MSELIAMQDRQRNPLKNSIKFRNKPQTPTKKTHILLTTKTSKNRNSFKQRNQLVVDSAMLMKFGKKVSRKAKKRENKAINFQTLD